MTQKPKEESKNPFDILDKDLPSDKELPVFTSALRTLSRQPHPSRTFQILEAVQALQKKIEVLEKKIEEILRAVREI